MQPIPITPAKIGVLRADGSDSAAASAAITGSHRPQPENVLLIERHHHGNRNFLRVGTLTRKSSCSACDGI
jgi:hypothetical protein